MVRLHATHVLADPSTSPTATCICSKATTRCRVLDPQQTSHALSTAIHHASDCSAEAGRLFTTNPSPSLTIASCDLTRATAGLFISVGRLDPLARSPN